jgi:hypothetical protein
LRPLACGAAEVEMSDVNGGGNFYQSDEEVVELLARVESCAIRPSEFGHRQHLAAALVYVLEEMGGGPPAHARLRALILRLLAHHQITEQVYHETLTDFWLRRVRAFARDRDDAKPLYQLANELCEQCGDARLVFGYYSERLVKSDAARERVVGPDLKALDF